MISVIITSFREPRTIGRAIDALATQKFGSCEILVVAPDQETLSAASKHFLKDKRVKVIKDEGKGKPAALNLAARKAKGDILVLTDGDVYVGEDAINHLLEPFSDNKVGAVSGRPVSSDSSASMMGFWAHMLTHTAHKRRLAAERLHKRFFCSGYLFAIRKKLFPTLPENLLSEDGYISHCVYQKGHVVRYAPNALVYVKYPTNFSDWIKQKKRSAGGYSQIRSILHVNIRSFKSESLGGLAFFSFVHSPKQLMWLFALFLARIYLWIAIYFDVTLKKKSQKELWQRVDSTK